MFLKTNLTYGKQQTRKNCAKQYRAKVDYDADDVRFQASMNGPYQVSTIQFCYREHMK